MTSNLLVSHYSGCGNDFLIVDDRQALFPTQEDELIVELCRNQTQVDGLILLRNSLQADFQMRIFNSDGSEASMCGNGIRCLMRYIKEKLDVKKNSCAIEISGRILMLEAIGSNVRVEMGKIEELELNICLPFEEEIYSLHHLNSGVPHLVTFVDSLESRDIAKVGAYFRHHEKFRPNGANVNFVDIKTKKIRTFERGVEAETQACGTGATAAAYALHKLHNIQPPILMQTLSGDFLEIDFSDNFAKMTGPATCIRDGALLLPHFKLQFHS